MGGCFKIRKGFACMFFAVCLSVAVGMSIGASAATITVGPGAEDFASIQDAIDAAAEGDTILVSPGTYNEKLVIFEKNNITIQSTGSAAATFIDLPNTIASPYPIAGGITIIGDNITFDGFTVRDRNTTLTAEGKIIRIGAGNAVGQASEGCIIRNCILQGNASLGVAANQVTDYGILIYGTNCQIIDNEVFDTMGSGSGINVVGEPWSDAEDNTISGNYLHHMGNAITLDRSPGNNVLSDNQFSDITGYAITCWGSNVAGTVIENHNFTGVPKGISLASACGVMVINNTFEVTENAIRLYYSSWAGPIVDNNVIAGNTITGADKAFEIAATNIGTNNFFGFNNIEGNDMGAVNYGEEEFVAEKNWWGDATGPYNGNTNIEGLGNEASDYIDFDPWLGAEVEDLVILTPEEPSSENGEDGIAVDVDFGEDGDEGAVIVASYGETNPTADDDFEGHFFDVYIAQMGDIEEIKVRLYYNELSAKVAYWHNGEEWIVCSDQEVVEGAVMLEDVMYDGYVEVTINDGTDPSLEDMTGTVIALRDTPLYDSVSGQSNCFIATAAFGSPFERHVKVLREFRDRYLLTNPVGQAFVRWYYRHSPQYASVIANNNILKTAARTALLPLYGVAFMALKGVFAYLVFGLGLLLLFALRRKTAKVMAVLLVTGLISVMSTTAFAADGNHFDVSPGDNYTVVVPTTSTIGHFKMSTDIFYSYGNRVIEVELAGTEMDLVENQHLLQLGLTFGICDIQQISIVVPYVADQISDIGGTGSSGLGDISVIYKYRFPLGNENGLKFAIAPYVQFDSGKDNIYMNAGSNVYGIRFIMDKKLGENVLFTGNLGYAYQSEEDLGDNIEIDQTLLFGTGMVFMIPETPSYIAAEIHGRSEELFDTENTPVEAILSYGCAMEHATFTIGGGLGLIDGYGAPDWRLFTGLRFKL